MVDGIQPYLRFIYVKYMGGVDLADQYLMSHSHEHRPQTFFWRRVFDQKFAQATSNAYLLFAKWAEGGLVGGMQDRNPGTDHGDGGKAVGRGSKGSGEGGGWCGNDSRTGCRGDGTDFSSR